MCRSYNTDAAKTSSQFFTLKSALEANYPLSHSCVIDHATRKAQHQTLNLCDKSSCLITDSNHNPTFCKRLSDQSQVAPQIVETKNASQLTSLLKMGYHNLPCSFCELPAEKPADATTAPACSTKPTPAPKCTLAPTPAPTPKCTLAPTPAPTPKCTLAPTPAPTPKCTLAPTPAPTPKCTIAHVTTSAPKRVVTLEPTPTAPSMCPGATQVVTIKPTPTPEKCEDNTCSTFPPQPKPANSCANLG